jgi:hypothetical protein
MPTVMKCPSCKKSLKLNDSLAGKRVRCPACQKPFQVPKGEDEREEVDELEEVPTSEEEAETAVQAKRPAARSRRPPDEDDEEDERPARRSRRARDEDEDDEEEEEERPRRRRRRRRRSGGDASAGTGPLVLGILSIVFSCAPIIGVILGRIAVRQADTAMSALSGSSRHDAARQRLQLASTLGNVGTILSIVMFVIAVIFNIMSMNR